MRYFAEHGIQLHYIEDPLPRTDLAGYRALRGQLPCLIAGHDYFDQISQFEDFIGAGVLDVVRSGANTSMQLPVAKLAVENDLPVFYGNSIGEQNAHAAAGLRGTERIEFSWLAWSALFQDPIRVENGCMVAPDRPGFGLDPAPGLLRDFHNPGVAVRKAWPCPWERRRH